MLLSAWLFHKIGFHAMLGSFVFGLVFPRGEGTPFLYTILSKVEPFATLVLLPLFFMVTGLSIDLGQLRNTRMELLYILLVASGGKFLGSGAAAKLLGANWRHAIAIGTMMNTRGLTEIVVLNIAQQANILDDEMFAMLVLMAVITTAAAGPLLRLLFSPAQLVKEHAADLAADAATAEAGKPPPAAEASVAGAARLVVLPHDVASASRLLAAAVATLAPGMRAHVGVVRFCTPADLHARTELGTGLLRSPEEVLSKAQLEDAVRAIARPNLTTSVTVATTEDPLGDALVHIRAAAPQLVVTDWPAAPEARARLRALVVHAPCTVVLWGGGGAPADASPRAKLPLPAAAEDDAVAADVPTPALPPTATHPAAPPPRRARGAALLALLRDEKAQDALVDAAAARLKRMSLALIARLPERLRRSDDSDDEDAPCDEEAAPPPPSPPAHGGSIELQPHALGGAAVAAPPSPTTDAPGSAPASALRVTANDASTVVTPHSMAVAAASSLSPKFSKLMVTGWPRDAAERSELVAFVHDVEHDVATAAARRASRMPSMHAALMRRSTSSGEVRGGVSPPASPPPAAPTPRGVASAPDLSLPAAAATDAHAADGTPDA
jgi:hypothetical protein